MLNKMTTRTVYEADILPIARQRYRSVVALHEGLQWKGREAAERSKWNRA